MGKVTGFLEFERLEEGYEPVEKRVKNYKEFVIGLAGLVACEVARTQCHAWLENTPTFIHPWQTIV